MILLTSEGERYTISIYCEGKKLQEIMSELPVDQNAEFSAATWLESAVENVRRSILKTFKEINKYEIERINILYNNLNEHLVTLNSFHEIFNTPPKFKKFNDFILDIIRIIFEVKTILEDDFVGIK